MRAVLVIASTLAVLAGSAVGAVDDRTPSLPQFRVTAGGSCKTVTSCREAVVLWCGGYSKADADKDGIPCENVCRSLQQVEAIKQEIGC